MKTRKATGLDGVKTKFLKYCNTILKLRLLHLFKERVKGKWKGKESEGKSVLSVNTSRIKSYKKIKKVNHWCSLNTSRVCQQVCQEATSTYNTNYAVKTSTV